MCFTSILNLLATLFGIVPILFSFAGTLVGAFIGVSGAFAIQSHFMKKSLKLRGEEEKKRRRYFLEILKNEIEHNVDLLKQIQKEYQNPNWVGYYNLDTTNKQAVWAELVKMEENAQFVNNLSRTYYEYEHINRKIDFQLNSAMFSIRDQRIANLRFAVVQGIVLHVSSLLKGSVDRLNEIEEKLSSL